MNENKMMKIVSDDGLSEEVEVVFAFEFKRENADEETTIGFAANYAAKLQGLSSVGAIAISSNIFDALEDEKKAIFVKHNSSKLQKYGEDWQEFCVPTIIV